MNNQVCYGGIYVLEKYTRIKVKGGAPKESPEGRLSKSCFNPSVWVLLGRSQGIYRDSKESILWVQNSKVGSSRRNINEEEVGVDSHGVGWDDCLLNEVEVLN